jgi:hypothetical protein
MAADLKRPSWGDIFLLLRASHNSKMVPQDQADGEEEDVKRCDWNSREGGCVRV